MTEKWAGNFQGIEKLDEAVKQKPASPVNHEKMAQAFQPVPEQPGAAVPHFA
jgi:hypothetical protein